KILRQTLEPETAPRLARHFLDVRDVAEFAANRGNRLVAGLATRHAVVDGHSEMSLDLFVELAILDLASRFPGPFHVSLSVGGSSINPASAYVSRCHLERSAASCFSPAAVRV